MTYSIDYAAEKRASARRLDAKLAEAKAELDRVTALQKPNRGRPKTRSIRDRLIYRAAVAGVEPEVLADRYDLTTSVIQRIVAKERGRMATEDAVRVAADAERLAALKAAKEDRRLARRPGGTPTTIERDREMAKAFAKGASLGELATEYGVAYATAKAAVARAKRAGEVVPDGRLRFKGQHAERDRAMYAAACAGAKMRELAQRHGLSVARVDEILRRERRAVEQTGRAA